MMTSLQSSYNNGHYGYIRTFSRLSWLTTQDCNGIWTVALSSKVAQRKTFLQMISLVEGLSPSAVVTQPWPTSLKPKTSKDHSVSAHTAQPRPNDCEHLTQTLLLHWSVCSVSTREFLPGISLQICYAFVNREKNQSKNREKVL
jgi:hypothetical protein